MTDESGPKNSLVTAFDAYQATEECREMLGYIKASKPSAILFMAFSAGWVARRDWHLKTYPRQATADRGNYEDRHPTDTADMAELGRAFMDALEQARMADPWVKGWAPVQCPSEIIFDLLNRIDDHA